MKSFREWKKINESYDFSLGMKSPNVVASTGNLSSFYDLLEAKKKAMKKKMELDSIEDDEKDDSVPTGDGEVVKPKSAKDMPDEDMDDEDGEDMDMDNDEDMDDMDDEDGENMDDSKKSLFMKKKMKKDKKDKKVKKEETWAQSIEDMMQMPKTESTKYFSIFEDEKYVMGTTIKEDVEKFAKQISIARDGKVTAKDEDGNIVWG